MSKKKVIIFAKLPPPYTGQTIGTNLVKSQIENEGKVKVINTSYGEIKPSQSKLGLVSYNIKFSIHFLSKIIVLLNTIRKHPGSIVYAIGSPTLSGHLKNIFTVLVSRGKSSKIVLHIRNGNYQEIFESRIAKRTAMWLRKVVDTFIFLSESLSRRAANYIPGRKRVVVRNTIDKKVRCSPDEVENKINGRVSRDQLRVTYLSNMILSKGYKDLARAAVTIAESTRGFDVQFDFIGDWPDAHQRDGFERFLEEHEISNHCNVRGRIEDRKVIKNVLLNSDVFVLPTFYPNEAQPRSIIEAFNAGTPVVSTQHASIPDYVSEGKNGFLVNKQAPNEIADALRLLAQVGRWRKLAHGARSTYEDMFSPSAVRKQMLDALHDS
ncbi:glycosyltransferase involved in cell wall biosynthesis [Salinibacter ruber]|uniref:glycosyltransferase family 4 protein n=1 Tax=Salinibacter ruber TaxID=146919 RepID=UPI0021671627|nr:glycosyltransferase family 4 protein [Salinibacter ruber]MCS3749297.1 glycosyltransferase involved in cell wall biosynthesis [Salinibacter ruber]